MEQEKVKAFFEKITKEIETFEKHMKSQGVDYVYNQSYHIALMQQLEYVFLEYMQDNQEDWEDVIKSLSNIKTDNLCEAILDDFKQYNHPERFNFFEVEDTLEIIDNFIKNKLPKADLYLELDELIYKTFDLYEIKVDKGIFDDFIKDSIIKIVFVDSDNPNMIYEYQMISEDNEDGVITMRYFGNGGDINA